MNTPDPRPTGRSETVPGLDEFLASIRPRPWAALTPEERAHRQEVQEIFLQPESLDHA